MYPILFQIQDGGIYTLKDIKDRLANQFKLSSSEIRELLPSGHQEIFYNRLGWARTYLKKAGLVEYVERGQFRITESGLNEIKSDINKITPSYLTKYDSFNEFRSSKIATNPNADNADETPDETFEKYFLDLDQNLKSELL
jgi:restriction system protein